MHSFFENTFCLIIHEQTLSFLVQNLILKDLILVSINNPINNSYFF